MALFISPPFGNYINLPKTKSIKGSFTLLPRHGLLQQIFKTLRYSFEKNGWINKIGLRNKGIEWAVNEYKDSDDIVSIAIMDKQEIDEFNKIIPDDMNLEINISCPNTEEDLETNDINKFLNPNRKHCCIKLSPHTSMELIDHYYQQGFRQFHCCNTIPIEQGGLSGPSLIPYTSTLVKQIKEKYPDTQVIAGGGIDSMDIVNKYKNCGADNFSVSTLLFNPFKFMYFYYKWEKN